MSNSTNASPLKITWYDSAKAVHDAMWAQALASEGVLPDEVDDVTFNAETVSGEVVTMTEAELLQALEDQGMWGFFDQVTRTIHAWASPTADPADVLHMIAHEIGHATGEQADDDLEEEQRADAFGVVAAEAFRMLATRPGFCVSGRCLAAYQH